MIYTDKTKKALKLCFEAHKNQVDKSGMPYVFHPFHVAEQMKDEATTHDAMQAVVDSNIYLPLSYTTAFLAYDADLNNGPFYTGSGLVFIREFSWK